MVQQCVQKTSEELQDEAQQQAWEQEDQAAMEAEVAEAVTMIQGAPPLKRLFQEMEIEEASLRTKEKDEVREARKTILKPPTGPLPSD